MSRDVSAQSPPQAELRPASEIRLERVYEPVAERPDVPAARRAADVDAAARDAAAARAPQPVVQAAPSRDWKNGFSVDPASPRAATSGLFGGWSQSEAEPVLMPPRRREVHHRGSRRAIRLLLAAVGALALIASAILALREYPLADIGLSVPVFGGGPDRTGGDVLKPAPPSDSLLNLFDRRAAALEQAIASYKTAEQSFARQRLRCPALRRAYEAVDERFVELAKVLVPFDARRTAEYDRLVGQVNGVEASFAQSACGTTGARGA